MVKGLVHPLATALRYVTAPYARGSATQELALGPVTAGASDVLPYDFQVLQSEFGLGSHDVVASYLLELRSDQRSGPVVLDIDYVSGAGLGTIQVVVSEGSLAGTTFAVAPLPNDPDLVLTRLTEHPPPGPGAPAGPNKWGLMALLGNAARLLWVLTGECGVLATTARDVSCQFHLRTARGASLDRLGQGLGVPRLPPSPYRVDLDAETIALYHFADTVAPVLDANRDYPGINLGAVREIAGRFGSAYNIIPQGGGVIIKDASAFNIDPTTGFTAELFVNLAAAPAVQETAILAVKKACFGQPDSVGWSLSLEPSGAVHDLVFALTDSTGTTVKAIVGNFVPPAIGGWFHVAGVVDATTKQAAVFVNGQKVASTPFNALGVIETGADIGIGADSSGAAHLNGSVDEVRFSNIARTDFSSVLGTKAKPYEADAHTIALYHFDETDDWIDDETGAHFAINFGAQRGAEGRFGGGLRFVDNPLPHARCLSEWDFQEKLRSGSWDRAAGGERVDGAYARFGYRQGAISEPGLDGALYPVLVNDHAGDSARGLVTTACCGFVPDDPNNTNDPSQTIAKFQAAGRTVREAIDYFGEWHGLDSTFFKKQYQDHGITPPYEGCIPSVTTPALVKIPAAAAFAFDATASFTVEALIRPDDIADDYARAIVTSRSSALLAGETNANEPGWALCLGAYHSIPNNLRWILGDASGALVTVDADRNLADGAFHHIAGVVDRNVGVARLYLDGVEIRQAPLGHLGKPASNCPIIVGNSANLDAPYAGLIEELRISRVARRQFEPVLGESDERYRQRLAIYQPWRLPTYPSIKRAVQALTLAPSSTNPDVTGLLLGSEPLPEDLVQFDIDDADSTQICASRWLRVIPKTLTPPNKPRQTIASDGTTPAHEPSTAGLPPLQPDHPALVSVPDGNTDGNNYSFATSRLMVLSTARMLERFAKRLAELASGVSLSIESAYIQAPSAAIGEPAATVSHIVVGGVGVNNVQTLSANAPPQSAAFTLRFNGQNTALIPFTATANQVQLALEVLSRIGTGNITVMVGRFPTKASR